MGDSSWREGELLAWMRGLNVSTWGFLLGRRGWNEWRWGVAFGKRGVALARWGGDEGRISLGRFAIDAAHNVGLSMASLVINDFNETFAGKPGPVIFSDFASLAAQFRFNSKRKVSGSLRAGIP